MNLASSRNKCGPCCVYSHYQYYHWPGRTAWNGRLMIGLATNFLPTPSTSTECGPVRGPSVVSGQWLQVTHTAVVWNVTPDATPPSNGRVVRVRTCVSLWYGCSHTWDESQLHICAAPKQTLMSQEPRFNPVLPNPTTAGPVGPVMGTVCSWGAAWPHTSRAALVHPHISIIMESTASAGQPHTPESVALASAAAVLPPAAQAHPLQVASVRRGAVARDVTCLAAFEAVPWMRFVSSCSGVAGAHATCLRFGQLQLSCPGCEQRKQGFRRRSLRQSFAMCPFSPQLLQRMEATSYSSSKYRVRRRSCCTTWLLFCASSSVMIVTPTG
jgi:hypothetical protein